MMDFPQNDAEALSAKLIPVAQEAPLESQKKLVLHRFKDKTLKLVDELCPPPMPGSKNVLIRVEASSVQSTDLLVKSGEYPRKELKKRPPITTGFDFAGRIVAFGDDVDQDALGLELGMLVCDISVLGGHARYIERPAASVVAVPKGLSAQVATSLVMSWMAAYQMLYRTKAHAQVVELKAPVLVQGGAGAVGQALITLARREGCQVIATARSEHHDLLAKLGAQPLDYEDKDWVAKAKAMVPSGVGASFDGVCADGFRSSRNLLSRRGVLVIYGIHAFMVAKDRQAPCKLLSAAFGIFRTMLGFCFSSRHVDGYSITETRQKHPEWFREDLAALFELATSGKLSIPDPEVIPFEEVNEGHERLMRGGLTRKLVLRPE